MNDRVDNDMNEAMKAAWQEPDVAKKYATAENATLPFARILVEKSRIAQTDREAHVFDLACGTGAVVKELYDAVPKEKWAGLKILGGDVTPDMLDYLKARGEKEGWTGLETQIVDGNDIKLPEETYTHLFLSFGVFVMPGALSKLYSLLKPGGFIGVTTWADLPWQPILARSVSQMTEKPYCPTVADLENKMYQGRPWGDKSYLTSQLTDAGFQHVEAVREQKVIEGSIPKEYMATMQIPLGLVTMFWEEGKRQKYLAELNEIMLKESIKMAGGEDKGVVMEFDANVAWGWKSG